MKSPNAETEHKINPELLLAGVENQARKTSYEQAVGASAHFVEKLVEAGQLKTIEAASEAFSKGVTLIKSNMQKELLEIQMKEIEAYLPIPEAVTDAKA